MTTASTELGRIRADLVRAVAAHGTADIARTRRPRRIVAVAAAATALLVLAGYTVASRWVGNAEFQDQYRAAQRALRLPPGATWPTRTIPRNVRVSTSEGGAVAVTIAWTDWACYWANAIQRRDERGASASARAMRLLLARNLVEAPAGSSEDFTTNAGRPIAIFATGGLSSLRAEYQAGLSGNPAPLAQDCRANSPAQ
jgi:hypothetical protein